MSMRISRSTAWVLPATAIGATLRLWSPGNGSLARDEALFLFVTRMSSLGDMLTFLRLHESHPPLFYLLMRGWTSVAGQSEAAAAVVPLVASIALIPTIYLVGSKAFSPLAGAIAAWVTALCPALIFYSPQIRPYSLFTLLAVASCALAWREAESPSRATWIGYVACTLGMLLTHHWGWIILAAQGIVWLAATLLLGGAFPSGVVRLGTAWLAVGTGYLPWLSALRHQVEVAGYPPQTMSALGAAFVLPRTFFGPSMAIPGLAAIGLLLAVVLAGLIGERESRRVPIDAATVFVPLVCVALAWPLTQRSALLMPHTLATLMAFLALLVGGATALVWQRGRRIAAALGAIGVAALMIGELNDRLRSVKSNARAVAARIAAQARSDDVVLIVPEALASSFNYYFHLPNRQIVFPRFARQEIMFFERELDRASDAVSVAAAADTLAQLHRRGVRVWFVSERDWVDDGVPALRAPIPRELDAYETAVIRANQLRKELVLLYGRPDTTAVPADTRDGIEIYMAMLFE